MARKPKSDKPLTFGQRVVFTLVGMGGLVVLLVYSFRWEDLPFRITLIGNQPDITPWFMASILVLAGIVFMSLFKSGFLGRREMD